MSSKSLREHSRALTNFAAESETLAAQQPADWLLPIVARNQRAAADEAVRAAEIEEAKARSELLEWRFAGNRLHTGHLPLDFLADLAAPLNNLLVRAAYFIRTGEEAKWNAEDALTREVDLALVGLEPGSTRLLIRGNVEPDTTGNAALDDAIRGVFSVLSSTAAATAAPSTFYESLDNIGERASEALHDTLKAIEKEQCSLEITWHRPSEPLQFAARVDEVTRLRALLDNVGEVVERHERLAGTVRLLSANGRLQLDTNTGKATVRFNPRTQQHLVGSLTLNSAVEFDVRVKVSHDPITGDEIRRYWLLSPGGTLLSAGN